MVRVENYGGPDLLAVKAGSEEFLVPFVRAICVEIDVTARRITAELPEGLKDLARQGARGGCGRDQGPQPSGLDL